MKNLKTIMIQFLALVFIQLVFGLAAFSQVTKTVHLDTPGTLSTLLSAEEKANVTHLTLTGKIDTRDIKTARDEMPKLEHADLAGTKIMAYTGSETGTAPEWFTNFEYPEDVLPLYSFENKQTLKSVILPDSIIKIDREAFQVCINLEMLTMGNLVQEINTQAFNNCIKLADINLSTTLEKINENAFLGCIEIVEMHLPSTLNHVGTAAFGSGFRAILTIDPQNQHFSVMDGVLLNADQTTIVASPAIHVVYTVPSTVHTIGDYSFYHNEKLETITFPEMLTEIKGRAFDGDYKISRINCKALVPPQIGWLAFRNVNKTSCEVFVPIGTGDAYRAAPGWSDFEHIIESDFSTGVKQSSNQEEARIFCYNGQLYVKNISPDTLIEVYLLSGQKILTFYAGNTPCVELPEGMFVVKAGDQIIRLLFN